MSSLKGEFVSHLVDKQFDISENENYKDDEHLLDLFEQTALTFDLGDDEKRGLLLQDKKSLASQRTICLTDIIRPPSYCIRSNNIAGFIEANKKIAEVSWTPVTAGGRTKNFLYSIIGENSIVADSSHIIRSVIGNNCTIGLHVKITDCVIFDGVNIEDGCILQQTVVCSDGKIGRKSSLERCIVSSGYKVHTESQFSDEFLADGEEGEFVVE
jgi:translation initiation factor eIF-2B subunit gamma